MRLVRTERKGDGNDRRQGFVESSGGGVETMVGAWRRARRSIAALDEGPGNNGIRDPGRGARRHSDSGHHGVQTEIAGAVECNRGGHKRLVSLADDDSGQSTVEFAVVTAGFTAVTVALAALWRALEGGLLVEHALAVASHHIQSVAAATIVDIFLY